MIKDEQRVSPAMALARFVRDRYGRVFDTELADRLLERVVPEGMDPQAAVAKLQQAPEDSPEGRSLTRFVTVGETFFFREAAQFQTLEDELPRLYEARGRKLHLWVAGTSTGEEAYSLAITALRAFGPDAQSKVSIDATDLNPEYLERARKGAYGRRSFRGTTVEQLAEFFEDDGETAVICDAAKRLVTFARHNLLSDMPYEEAIGTPADVLLCRNVCLYFDKETFRKVQLRLARTLSEGGVLLLGAAETVLHDSGLVRLERRDKTFIYVKGSGSTALPAPPAVRQAEFRRATGLLGKRPFHGGTGPLRPLPFRDEVDEEPPVDQGILGEAAILLDMGETQRAAVLCHAALEEDPFRPAAHFLLGLARRLMGSYQEAVHQFRAAAYLQQDDWLASFHLAEAYRALDCR
ncbi:MAG: hypothetical protein KGR26_10725, partial [Cyanobacteria bacterium REEB65]|nr:hypothetical protein [Cyanobacteria bacterium REEB65]